MFTDDELRAAAGEWVRYVADALPEPEDCAYEFSPQFERKMGRLIRRTAHPYRYRILQRAAGFFLALLMGGSLLLILNTEVRAIVFGWVKEQYETVYYHYFYEGTDIQTSDKIEYRLTWVPDGYKESEVIKAGDNVTVLYVNEEGQYLSFEYIIDLENSDLYIETVQTEKVSVMIGNTEADLYLSTAEDVASAVVWADEETDHLFLVSAFLEEEELVKIAKSVSS